MTHLIYLFYKVKKYLRTLPKIAHVRMMKLSLDPPVLTFCIASRPRKVPSQHQHTCTQQPRYPTRRVLKGLFTTRHQPISRELKTQKSTNNHTHTHTHNTHTPIMAAVNTMSWVTMTKAHPDALVALVGSMALAGTGTGNRSRTRTSASADETTPPPATTAPPQKSTATAPPETPTATSPPSAEQAATATATATATVSATHTEFDYGAKMGEGAEGHVQQFRDAHLRSAKQWGDLPIPEQIKANLVLDFGYSTPSKIQSLALPLMMDSNDNLVFQSQPGTGKTAAFAIKALSSCDPNLKQPQVIILAPTKFVVDQHVRVLEQMAKGMGVTIEGHYSWEKPRAGAAYTDADTKLKAKVDEAAKTRTIGAHIVVGTPGKVRHYLQARRGKNGAPVIDAGKINLLVVDEADNLLSCKLKATTDNTGDCMDIRSTLLKPHHQEGRAHPVQFVLCSATYEAGFDRLFSKIVPAPFHQLRLKPAEAANKNVKQFYIKCPDTDDDTESIRHKCIVINELFKRLGVASGIIFCERRVEAEAAALVLKNDRKLNCETLHGGLPQVDQRRILDAFRSGKVKFLCSTNVLARGVDIPACSMVINVALPVRGKHGAPDCETYLHRVGRAGRFGAPGFAVALCSTAKEVAQVKKIERHWQHPIELLPDPFHEDGLDAVEDVLE